MLRTFIALALGRIVSVPGLTCLSFAWASAISAQAAPSISGHVTSSESGRPVRGARVEIDQAARFAVTDDAGFYVLRDVPAGRYRITATAIGRSPSRRMVTVAQGLPVSQDITLARGSLTLSSVIVSATRTPTDASKVASAVDVLTPQEIATSPARESQDLLREIPSVELPRTSSNVGGSAQIVSIRGVDEGRTIVTSDGVPINDAWGEWIDWSRVPKASLDRVEVVQGGSSNLYGNGAMGGTISFFSRDLGSGAYHVQADGGSRNSRHVYAAAGVPLSSPFSAMVSGDYGDGGGYRLIAPGNAGPVDHESESVRRNAMARLAYSPSSRLTAYVGSHFFDDDRDLGTPLSRTTRRNTSVDIGLDVGESDRGRLSVRGWDGVQRETQYVTAIAADRASERRTAVLDIPSHDWGIGAQWSRGAMLGFESVSLGADMRHMNGFTGEQDFAANGTTSYVFSGGDQLLGGGFVQGILAPAAPVRIELGGRFDHWTNANGVTRDAAGATAYADRKRNAFSPRIGVRYQVVPPLSFHAAVYRAFRAPNLAELYRKFVSGANTNLPNPALTAEFATGYEAGVDWHPAEWVQLTATAYSADMRDLNTFVTIAPNTRQRQNVQKTRSRGGEALLALHPSDDFFVRLGLNYDDDKIVAAPNAASIGTRVGRVPVQKDTLRISYTSAKVASITVLGRHEGVTTTLQGVPLEPYSVVDIDLRREVARGLGVFVAVENVADAEYQINLSAVANGIVSLGMPRTVRAGLDFYRF
jgi:outer membrane receptor protein involved in Fe transport